MNSPFLVIHHALATLVRARNPNHNNTNAGSTSDGHTIATNDNSSFLDLLVSSSALLDWIKLGAIGGFIELCRRSFYHAYDKLYNYFFFTAVFTRHDNVHCWVMYWLSQQRFWSNVRDVEITTRTFGLKGDAVLIPGEKSDDPTADDRPLAFLPSRSTTHTFWYKNRWCRVRRYEKGNGNDTSYSRKNEEFLELRIFTWSSRVFFDLLLEAKQSYLAAQEDCIAVYVPDYSHWEQVTTRPKRRLSSIILEPGLKEHLLQDAREFLAAKRWYATRGIPFRRGYLFYGAPGSGKTSIIHGLAGELGLDVYIISLSRPGLDDDHLSGLIAKLPGRCIALMEDIDAAFPNGLNRESSDDESGDEDESKRSACKSAVTLSGLLNALDGISAQEGRLLFATTNRYQALDPALIRPGRMDIHIEFKLASKHQARELYRCFFSPDFESEADSKQNIQFEKETTETSWIHSKHSSTLRELEVTEAKSNAASLQSTPLSSSFSDLGQSSSESVADQPSWHLPRATLSEIDRLAAAFANILPEHELSMASLQGYLMMYRTRPIQAVKNFEAWIEKEKEKEKAKEIKESIKEGEKETGEEDKGGG